MKTLIYHMCKQEEWQVAQAAGAYGGWELWQSGNVTLQADALIAAALAFVAALIAIAVMMVWVRRASFTPFVIYRLALGGVLLYWIYI